jgi:hypothetical protein
MREARPPDQRAIGEDPQAAAGRQWRMGGDVCTVGSPRVIPARPLDMKMDMQTALPAGAAGRGPDPPRGPAAGGAPRRRACRALAVHGEPAGERLRHLGAGPPRAGLAGGALRRRCAAAGPSPRRSRSARCGWRAAPRPSPAASPSSPSRVVLRVTPPRLERLVVEFAAPGACARRLRLPLRRRQPGRRAAAGARHAAEQRGGEGGAPAHRHARRRAGAACGARSSSPAPPPRRRASRH